jgi:hypothetical protein
LIADLEQRHSVNLSIADQDLISANHAETDTVPKGIVAENVESQGTNVVAVV